MYFSGRIRGNIFQKGLNGKIDNHFVGCIAKQKFMALITRLLMPTRTAFTLHRYTLGHGRSLVMLPIKMEPMTARHQHREHGQQY